MDANINIKYSQFLNITKDILTEQQCKEIFMRACKFRPTRILIKAPKVKIVQVEKVLRHSNEELFNNLLSAARLDKGHKFIDIRNFDPEWNMLVNISADAEEFCKLFNFTDSQGYQVFITSGLKIMGKNYRLQGFRYYKEKIFREQESKDAASNDPDPSMTNTVYNYFIRHYKIKDNSAYKSLNIANFVYICDRIRERGISWKKYMDCQFEWFDSFNKIPEPAYLHTEDAFNRTLKINR